MFKLNVNKKCYYSVVVVVIFVVATIYICAVDMLHFKNLTIVWYLLFVDKIYIFPSDS